MEKRAAMNEQASERLLIEACQKGDREAFRQLYEIHKDRIYSIAVHFTGDESTARDITQQVFLKLFTRIGEFRFESGFSTWLYRLVVNGCLDEERKHRRFLPLEILSSGEHRNGNEMERSLNFKEERRLSTEDDQYFSLEQSAIIKSAVKNLKPKQRIAILLKYFEGMTYDEMAQVLGCSMGTIASRLNRGHKELAKMLAHLKS